MAGVYGGNPYPSTTASGSPASGIVNDAWYQTGFTVQQFINGTATYFSSSESPAPQRYATEAPESDNLDTDTSDVKDK